MKASEPKGSSADLPTGGFVKVKTSTLIGPALDWAVAQAEGVNVRIHKGLVIFSADTCPEFADEHDTSAAQIFTPTQNWAQAGPIIEREGIDLYQECRPEPMWVAEIQTAPMKRAKGRGRSPLIAAARCYVASQFGVEVEIPAELANTGDLEIQHEEGISGGPG